MRFFYNGSSLLETRQSPHPSPAVGARFEIKALACLARIAARPPPCLLANRFAFCRKAATASRTPTGRQLNAID
ncbi:MAG: hypothetical protein ACYSX1_11375 [Planctomycetota bacterium]